jgi:hypothetical protein
MAFSVSSLFDAAIVRAVTRLTLELGFGIGFGGKNNGKRKKAGPPSSAKDDNYKATTNAGVPRLRHSR